MAAYVRVLAALHKRLTPAHIKAAQDFIAEGLRDKPNPYQLHALVRSAQALAIELTPEQIESAVDFILSGIQKITVLGQQLELVGTLELLVPRLPPDRIPPLLERLVKILSSGSMASHGRVLVRVLSLLEHAAAAHPQSIDVQNQALLEVVLIGLRTNDNSDQLNTIVAVLRRLLPKLTSSQVHAALNAILESLDDATNRTRLSALVAALQGFGADLAPVQVDLALKTVLKILQRSDDPDQLPETVRVLNMLAPKLTPPQIQITTDAMLEGLRSSRDPDQLVAYADVLERLAPMLPPDQIGKIVESAVGSLSAPTNELDNLTPLLGVMNTLRVEPTPKQLDVVQDAVLRGLRNSIDPDQLRTFVETFLRHVSKLTEKQIDEAREVILEGLRTSTDYDQLPALVQVLEAVVKRLTPEQLEGVRQRIVEDLKNSTNPYQLREFVNVTRMLGIKLTEAQVQTLFNFVLRGLRPLASLNPSQRQQSVNLTFNQMLAFAGLLRSLSGDLTRDQIGSVVQALSGDLSRASNPSHARAVAQVLRMLAPILTPEQVGLVIDDHNNDSNIRNLAERLTFVEALAAPDHARIALDGILRELREQTSRDRLSALVAALRPLARVNLGHNIVIDETLIRLSRGTNSDQLSATVNALQVFVPGLTPVQVSQVLHGAVEDIPVTSEQLSARMNVLRVIAPKLTPEQLSLAFTYVLDRSRTSNTAEQSRVATSVLEALGDALKALAPKMSSDQLQATLGALIKSLHNTDIALESARFIRTLEDFAPHLAADQIAMLASIAQARLALAVGPEEGAAWARLLTVELKRRPEETHLREVIKILKYPTSAGEPTAVLLSGIRDRFSTFPRDGGLWELIAWVKERRVPALQSELTSPPVNPSARAAAARRR